VALGDSKTWLEGWQPTLLSGLVAAGTNYRKTASSGVNGATVASYAADIAANLSGINPDVPVPAVLINLGVNEIGAPPASATWRANYQTIIDAVHAKWAIAVIYIAYPWRQGFDANAAVLHGYIDQLLTDNVGLCVAGPDEVAVIQPPDDGATNTTDGIHYSAAGNVAWASAWETTLLGT